MSDELKAKVAQSIQYTRSFAPPRPDKYWLAFSGGKDSVVSKKIADLAGVDYEAHYSVTSVDPPELMRYIRDHHPDVQWDYPRDKNGKRISMWTLIADHTLPPTRMVRYCCSALKESSGMGRTTLTGVRWAESANRKASHGVVDFQTKPKGTEKQAKKLGADFEYNKHGSIILNNDNDENRRLVEQCYRTRKTLVNPIVRWTDQDVWDFIYAYHLPYCSLYDEGFTRLGCIGCPLGGRKNMERDFERWPRYRELYIRAFEKMIENHPGQIKILEPGYKATYPIEPENLTGGGTELEPAALRVYLGHTWSDMNTNGNNTQTQPNECCTIGQKSEPSDIYGGVSGNCKEMDEVVPRRRSPIRERQRLKDGCVWCIKKPNGNDILKYMLWSTNPVGVPEVLVFSNSHTDADDLIRDMERTAEMYGGTLDKKGLKDF